MKNSHELTENKSVLRWLFFFPLAIVGAFIGGFLWSIINKASLGLYFSIDGFFYKLLDFSGAGFIAGAIFIFLGVQIAPYKKHSIAIFLLILSVIFSLLVILGNIFLLPEIGYWEILLLIFIIIGSLFAFTQTN